MHDLLYHNREYARRELYCERREQDETFPPHMCRTNWISGMNQSLTANSTTRVHVNIVGELTCIELVALILCTIITNLRLLSLKMPEILKSSIHKVLVHLTFNSYASSG